MVNGYDTGIRLERKNNFRREDRDESWSSWANLENTESWTGRGKRLVKHAVTDSLSRTCNSTHSTYEVTRQINGDEDQVKRARTKIVIRQIVVERGLVNHA